MQDGLQKMERNILDQDLISCFYLFSRRKRKFVRILQTPHPQERMGRSFRNKKFIPGAHWENVNFKMNIQSLKHDEHY